ncbi:NAD-dependent epimerase/dehydratase family protein [Arthrobacter sp. NPDC090010]|uniref:NAD-dependent epimerase/dehydratase family protein n=1 Tax=Arthrobacter sp. NPDC090010 TaxID=3363942 RepID=UPI00381DDF70
MTDATSGTKAAVPSRRSSRPRILLLGPTGFVGRRIVASLMTVPDVHLTMFGRSAPMVLPDPNATIFQGDILDATSIDNALTGADVVIHAASVVNGDPDRIRRVNEDGARLLLDGCARHGIRKVVYLSTASVYGNGPHRELAESGAGYSPQSAVSRSRAEADRMTLAHGGTVVRPPLTFGSGDRWFLPGLLKMMGSGLWPGDGSERLSLIDVEALGRAVTALALSEADTSGRAFHVAARGTVTVAELLISAAQATGLPLPVFEHDDGRARDALQTAGFTDHQVNLLSTDHWFSTKALESLLPALDFGPRLPSPAQWRAAYRGTR